VTTIIRFYYDATTAVALSLVFAVVVGLIAAVIVGGSAPSLSLAIIAFALLAAILLLHWQRGWPASTSGPVDRSQF